MSVIVSDEIQARQVMVAVRETVRSGVKIMLPPRLDSSEPPVFVENPFGGQFGDYRYQFEGEEDLLHLLVVRIDGAPISAEEARIVAGALFEGVASALIWLKPGHYSQHFYVGHDDLLGVGPA